MRDLIMNIDPSSEHHSSAQRSVLSVSGNEPDSNNPEVTDVEVQATLQPAGRTMDENVSGLGASGATRRSYRDVARGVKQ